MPDWIERPPQRRVPWPRILTAVGLVLLLFLGIRVLTRHSPKSGRASPTREPSSVIVSSGTIGLGGSLSQSMESAEILPTEAAQVERTLRPLFNPRYSKANHNYEITRSTDGHFIEMTYWPNAYEYFTVTRSSGGLFAASAGKIQLEETIVGVSGQIEGSLWEAMITQEVPPEMIYRFAEMFGWRIDFLTEPRVGDTYKMVWKRYLGTNAVKDGDIVCAYYNSKEKGGLYAFPLAKEYYDQEGNSLRGEFLRAPLAYRRISSRFSEKRFHPILRYYRPHHGIDYSAARGTPAVSIGEGTVIGKGYEKGLGNAVRVRHTGSYVSIYGHLMGYAKNIRVGGRVNQGQVVGYVGSSGLSTGPHLHFGFERAGQLINFLGLKSSKLTQKQVPVAERKHFEDIKKQAFALFAQLTRPSAPLQSLKSVQ